MLQPCPSGEILYIKAGPSADAYALSWAPFIDNRVTINIDIYSGITWYVVGFCCNENGQPECNTYNPQCNQNSIESIAINLVTQVGTGPCPTFKTNVCCVNLFNCDTQVTMSAVMNDADIPFWNNLQDNGYSVYLDYYNISGLWNVNYICCNYDNPIYDECQDNSCSINNFYIDPEVITGIVEVNGCYITCYTLRPCNGGPDLNYRFDNSGEVFQYIDTAVTVEEIPGRVPAGTYYLSVYCTYYPANEQPCCAETEAILVITDSYEDCACFLGPEPVKYTRVIPKPDRFFYKIDQSQCDITANIQFGEAYYRLFKNIRYGINDECDTLSLDRLWIKKELSDYALMYDPTLCVGSVPPETNCADPCNLTR
jgi:hypothetical protein